MLSESSEIVMLSEVSRVVILSEVSEANEVEGPMTLGIPMALRRAQRDKALM
jgi:hypothetical protein